MGVAVWAGSAAETTSSVGVGLGAAVGSGVGVAGGGGGVAVALGADVAVGVLTAVAVPVIVGGRVGRGSAVGVTCWQAAINNKKKPHRAQKRHFINIARGEGERVRRARDSLRLMAYSLRLSCPPLPMLFRGDFLQIPIGIRRKI